ncbi:hypothetical protein IQ241_14145 [Romeria aff. gracilis LEGE 07310]|uniref:Uncharacterized protein n=1 Tax=Vasconcelosia minhoensis LEGE 07310 TaxID=915328 RepID=A0A8J7A7K7_9CYAN|nr:hypothetical protein [Romeria gracilis]MBE9078422.1 hypothetical protein [Romeria aff. gracilis LEGE 07310]
MSQITINLVQGSVRFNFSQAAAAELKGAIADLMQSLKTIAAAKSSGGIKTPEPSMEYQHTGDVFLEIFCNPNIWPSPFAAKLLITVRDDKMRLTTEAELTRLIEDLNLYLE